MSDLMNPETQATNPGNVNADLLKYITANPKPFLICIPFFCIGVAALFVGIYTEVIHNWLGFGIFALSLCPPGLHLYTIKYVMKNGDTCPAVVIDEIKSLVAVWADMSTGPGQEVAAIRVLEMELSKATGSPFQQGSKLPVICTYEGPMEADHWEKVNPVPIGIATKKEEVIARKLASIPDNQWAALEAGLANLPKPIEPGLHFLG